MTVNSKELANAPVRTESGKGVGRVASLDVDADTGRLVAVRIRSGVVPHLLDTELLVAWSQVVSLSKDEVIVKDAAIPVGASALAKGLGSHGHA